jgi:DnaJ-class molecular chaperone
MLVNYINMETNLYEALGVSETAPHDEIKKAYRKLSLQYHPDRNGNSAESTTKIQQINAAYDIIGDESKRREYDMRSKLRFNPFGDMGMGMGMGNMPKNGIEIDPTDILNFFSKNFFNGASMNGMRFEPGKFGMDHIKTTLAKPTPIIKTETITLSKAYTGYNMPLEITRWIIEGEIKREETETIYIPIPRGIDNNEIIILREKGNSLSDTNKGDIKVFIKIQNDTEFIRNGLDITLNKTITLKDALCGFTFDMNYLDGRVYKINNNAGNIISQTYNKVLAGLGMKREEHIGNLIINFSVTFPEKLTEAQINGLREIL